MRVTSDGVPVELGGRRPATVLASLALAGGRPLGVDRLIELVWGDDPPPSARRSVQSYVAGLRTALGGEDSPIRRRGGGYVLAVARSQVDLLALEDLAETASDRGRDEPDEVIALLREAVSSWDRPLEGLDPSPTLCAVLAPYEALRLQALEVLHDLELRHGHAGAAVARLSTLTRECPLRERFWAQLVRGLTVMERRDQALFAMQRAREVLREQLGVDPSPLLASVERALLGDAVQHVPEVVVGPGLIDQLSARVPLPSNELVGRRDELRRVMTDVCRDRLVTLTGTGGVGKTRLAIEVARTTHGDFRDGVWFVELASVSDPGAVAAAFASALSVGARHGDTIESAIVSRLAGRHVLLVVDNCEHVAAAAATLIGAINRSCATAAVLATSRQPLAVPGERVHVVPPLDPASDGVELFLAFAAAADATFASSTTVDAALSTIAEICRRLGGIPLAIQLAASRMRALSPGDLLAHLDDRFGLLQGGSTDATSRHHTIRSSVDWSYQLMTPQEQLAFDRLSVFAGGFDLAAAEAVCTDQELPANAVARVVGSLVDKSMVLVERQRFGVRYRLLEPLRQFGAHSLAARNETTWLLARHLDHYMRVAVDTRRAWLGPRQADAEDVYTREWANLRLALDTAVRSEAVAAADAIIDAAAPHAWSRMEYEHGDWARKVLDLAGGHGRVTPATYAWAAHWTFLAGGPSDAVRLARQGIAASPHPTQPRTAWCWATTTWALLSAGSGGRDAATAALNADEASRNSDGFDRCGALCARIEEAITRSAPDLKQLVAQYGSVARQIGSPSLRSRAALYEIGLVTELTSDPLDDDPFAIHRVGLELARSVGDVNQEGKHLFMVAAYAMRTHRPDAATVTSDVVEWLHQTRQWSVIWMLLDYAAAWMVTTGRCETAAVVLGHTEAHHPSWSYSRIQSSRAHALQAVRTLADADELMADGAATSRDEVVDLVVHALRNDPRDIS